MSNNDCCAVAKNPLAEETRNEKFFQPRVDIFETPTEILVSADIPGVKAGDIDLRYENGELVVRGKVTRPETKGNIVFREFEIGDFYRVFQVHETIDSTKIHADHKNGVLTVHLPKQEAVQPKQVPIRVRG